MSEARQWIDPALDGSGGGFGKFKGMSIREMSGLFQQFSAESNMRSVTAILRICHEQLEARSALGVATQASRVLGVITALQLVALLLVPEHVRPVLIKSTGLSAVLFAGFLGGALSNRSQVKQSAAQERAIGEMAVDVLEKVVTDPGFKAKGLDSLQTLTLKRLIKISKTESAPLTQAFNL